MKTEMTHPSDNSPIADNESPRTITGGRAGFVRAVDEAFKAHLHNPTVRYSHRRGFHVESGLVQPDPDVVWAEAANYILPSGRRSVRPADYVAVREAILSAE